MAALAGVGSEGRDVAMMTVIARERSFRRGELMRFQREAHRLMWKIRALHYGLRGIGPFVFRMTMTAIELWITVQHLAVHRSDIFHLNSDLAVTGGAAIRHRRGFPWRDVTGFTVPSDLRM